MIDITFLTAGPPFYVIFCCFLCLLPPTLRLFFQVTYLLNGSYKNTLLRWFLFCVMIPWVNGQNVHEWTVTSERRPLGIKSQLIYIQFHLYSAWTYLYSAILFIFSRFICIQSYLICIQSNLIFIQSPLLYSVLNTMWNDIVLQMFSCLKFKKHQIELEIRKTYRKWKVIL